MIEVILVVCLAADLNRCERRVVDRQPDIPACQGVLSEQAAAFLLAHPGWVITGLACRAHRVAT